MRTFVAVEIDEQVRNRIAAFQQLLMRTGADVKWVKTENLHVTLKFFGDISEDQAGKVLEVMGQVIGRHNAFALSLEGSGAFPNLDKPRVIWIGAGEGRLSLESLQRDMEAELVREGFVAEDRPFRTHITLGRMRSAKGAKPLSQELAANASVSWGTTRVTKVTLMQSRLFPSGPVYTPIGEVWLKESKVL